MAKCMRTAWRHFRAAPTHFRSRDVINVISGETAITPLFFKLKTSSKNTKMLHVYILLTVPDRPIVTITHR